MNLQHEAWQDMELEQALPALAGHDVPWVRQARQSALERFAAQGFPTRKDEEWKYTSVSALNQRASLEPDHISPYLPSEAALTARTLAQAGMHLMVFVNGYYVPGLSAVSGLPRGLRLENLAEMLDDDGSQLRPFFAAEHEPTVFSALNTAYATDGAVLSLAPGTVLEAPIYLLFIASGEGAAIYPRNIIVMAEGSGATVIEHYLGAAGAQNFTDAVTQIDLDSGAELQHYKLLQEADSAIHIADIHAEQAADSNFTSYSFALGGHLIRNNITVRLTEPGCACTLNGLYVADAKQHIDHHTRVDHLAPDGTSREYYRGVLDGESRGVFNGKVIVHPGAVRTNAHQSNHNLLLSRQAEVDTKPQLEIFADDVKCTHGATVGQLDEDSMFFLRSRGIDADLARTLLIHGFANDIISKIEVPTLRATIQQLVLERMAQGESIEGNLE